jgi:hypothetical protein
VPLEEGYIYVGVAGLNPETNPQLVYWDECADHCGRAAHYGP